LLIISELVSIVELVMKLESEGEWCGKVIRNDMIVHEGKLPRTFSD